MLCEETRSRRSRLEREHARAASDETGRSGMRSTHWVVGLSLLTVTTTGSAITACGTGGTQQQPSTLPTASTGPGESPTSEVHKRGGKKLIAEVGPRGGTLELGNGARIAIPEGALSETVEVTFAEGARTTAFSNHEYERAVGPTLEISPEVSLGAPLTVSVPLGILPAGFTDSDLTLGLEVVAGEQRAVQTQNVQTRWDYLPATNKSGRAVAELSSVPGYRVQFLVSKND